MSEPTLAEAGPLGAREDACRDYQSSLEDLTVNSKPHINMLTILAQENLHFAKDIVSLIEAQTAKAPSSEKLPVMYLMDSIVKNVGREYLTAFTTNLVATFIPVFEKVDKNTRKSLFKLRSTWNEIFPLKILHALDVRVNSLDPAWPVQPLPPNQNTSSIHVTSTFLNKSPEEPSAGKMCHSGCKQSHMEDFVPPSREERNAKRSAEQDVRDPKRIKKTEDERPQENKSLQQGEDHSKSPHLRRRESWSSAKGVVSPRAPKQQHRLSVDANLQVFTELTLASKRELLQKTSEHLASGEITQDEYLVVAPQIRQLFQYQEGVREEQRSPFNDRFPLKRPRCEDAGETFVDTSASRLAGLDTNQRLTVLAEDRPLFDEPSRPSVTRDGPTKMIFEGPNKLSPRIDGPSAPGFLRLDGSPGQMGAGGPLRFEGPPGPEGTPLRFEGPVGQAGRGGFRLEGSPGLRFEGPHGQPMGGLRFDNPGGQPIRGHRFEGGRGPSGPAIRFDGPHSQPEGGIRFEGPLLQHGVGMRFEGPHGQSVAGLRFEGQHNQLGGNLRFQGPHGQPGFGIRFEGPLVRQGGGMRFDGPVPGGGLRLEGPLGQGGPRLEGCHAFRFDGQPGQPSLLPRFDGLHGQLGPRFERTGQPGSQRFDGPPGQQVQPRFDGVPQRLDGPQHQQASRFGVPLGLQGTRFDNHPSQRLESVSFRQTGPYSEPPGNAFNAPSQGLQFPRHEQIFDSPQGPNFNGLRGPGNQSFSNPLSRASGHSFDEKNLQSPQCGNFGNLPAQITAGNMQVSQQVLTGVAQPVPFGQGQQFLPVHPKNPGAFVQNPSGALPKAYPDHHLSQADANELFSKLLRTGIRKLSQPDSATAQVNEVAAQPPTEEKEGQNEDRDVPDLTNFTMEELKQRYDSVINQLHTGIQCYSCGMRFTTSQADVYADHLDWHYRQNRTKKDVSRKVTHRRWYYSSTDWIEFEEIADLEERAKSQFLEKAHEEVVLKTQQAAKEKQSQSVPAGPAGAVESCEICQDQFEQYWDDEEEEWHLKNAIRVDGKICHPSCYEDDQNTSSFDCTPSPSKKPVENPLNIMLNMVRNEFQEPCESTNVKEEQIDTPPACTEDSIATSQSCSRDMGFTRRRVAWAPSGRPSASAWPVCGSQHQFSSSPGKDGNCPVTLPEQAPPLLRFRRVQVTPAPGPLN